MKEEYETVKLPKSLLNKIREHLKETEFRSVSEYITFVLQEVVTSSEEDVSTEEERKKIEERLRALGYLG